MNKDNKITTDAARESANAGTIDGLIDAFQACAQTTDDGAEFWYARDLQRLFDYGEWRNFHTVIERAQTACLNSGNPVDDHFVDVNKMIDLAKGAQREVQDFMLSRYACYLTAQNADARKRPVAFAQTYFAIQSRRQELADQGETPAVPMSEDEKRIYLRTQIKEHNKHLSSAAKNAGVVTPHEFAVFHSHGYQGLYGRTVPEIRRHKGLSKSADILDRMGSTELAANFFRVTQTEEKLRKDKIVGKEIANQTHFAVGRQVREAMLKISGIAPEDLPTVETIKIAEKRLRSRSQTAVAAHIGSRLPEMVEIDIERDLWIYALLIIVQQPDMEISLTDLAGEISTYITLPDDTESSEGRSVRTRYDQLISDPSDYIARGLVEETANGFKATRKGLDFVLQYFANLAKE